MPRRSGPGRQRAFCKDSCRQLDYQARRRASEVGLGDDELIIKRSALDELLDKLYTLEAAVEDVDQDLDGASTLRQYKDAVAWLLAAARPLQAVNLT